MPLATDGRPRVVLACNALTIGGTEKMLTSFALGLDRERFDVAVVGVERLGPRQDELEAGGVPVACADADRDRLVALLEGADVVHIFRAGFPEPLVPAACRAAGVPHLVETNIFGSIDDSADEAQFSCHTFMSMMCELRYRDRLGTVPTEFHRRHRVLSAPIEYDALRAAAPSQRDARMVLGLDLDRPVVGRVGRDADLKWRNILVDMLPDLARLVPDVQVLFVGATPAKRRRIARRGLQDRCVIHEPTLDPERLAAFYVACDVFVSAAEIGESQGIAIGEALALGVPVVTCSTPWADNAQVEFVEHGRSGWFAGHHRSFAEAVADLLVNDERRREFGNHGRIHIERTLARGPLVRQAETLYASLASGNGVPDSWSPSPAEVDAFASEYARRAAAEFRPLTARERAEARVGRLRERGAQLRASLEASGRVPFLRRRS